MSMDVYTMRKGELRGIHIGHFYQMNNTEWLEVLEINNKSDVKVRFLEYPHIRSAHASEIRNGGVRNPMRPIIAGVGYTGVGPIPYTINRDLTRAGQTWNNMLKRVLQPKRETDVRLYGKCKIHTDWLNFQNFGAWYHQQIDRFGEVDFVWNIDKDLLVPGNKVYGPDTCIMVPSHINCLLTDSSLRRGKYPMGVLYENGKYIAYCNSNQNGQWRVGSFDTIPDAQRAYWSEKFRVIQETAIRYWHYLPEPLAYRLLLFNWSDALAYYGDDARIWSE